MYLTFDDALKRIKKQPAKNKNYAQSRIRGLIKTGELIQAKPEIFVLDENGEFVSLGTIKTEGLVTLDSVNQYVIGRENEIKKFGVVSKGGRPIRAVFSDGTTSRFETMGRAESFFKVTRYMIQKSINENRSIDFGVSEKRAAELGIEYDPEMTEHVKFKYD